MAAPRLFRVIAPVSDIDRAAAFYAIVLGTDGERVSNGRHYFDCGGTILACYNPAEHGERVRPNPDALYFAVADLEAAFDRARRAGCSQLDERIATQPWGERSFYAKDPFGNPLCFVDETTLFTRR